MQFRLKIELQTQVSRHTRTDQIAPNPHFEGRIPNYDLNPCTKRAGFVLISIFGTQSH